MVIGKIKPTATIVAQFAAGVEVEAIQHDGKLFMPVVGMGEFAASDKGDSPKRTEEPTAPKPAEKKSVESKAPAKESSKTYTEDELMDMDTKDLLKMCKSMGIDPDDSDGKNTNKKLRKLILAAQEASDEKDADNDEDDADDEEEEDDLTSKVSGILEDFDGGKKNKKKTIASLCDLGDVDKDDITELVEEFEDDADADIDATAEKIAKVLRGEKKDAKKTPAKKSPKKSKKDEDLVDVADLEVGDRVSVWWDDDNQEWYDGEVKSISKKGKVVIAYDDDTEDTIDPEIHTKIKRLED